MKKIAIALLTMLSFSVGAKALSGTNNEVEVDPTAYERVFSQCLSTFKVDAKKDAESLSDLVEACQKSAQKIAARSEYVGSDDKYYITIKPTVPRTAGNDVKPINPVNN